MTKSKILLAVEPLMLRQLLRRVFSKESDIEIVGEVTDPIDAMAAIRQTNADVLVHSWEEGGQLRATCSHLFSEYPELLMIGVSPEEEAGYAYRKLNNMDSLYSVLRRMRNPD